ncbi:MAG: hypothetical protein KME27_27950 [Lyngbya sp. HA4199-MV5]|nr:hypothetical protein [Lyngbya sp. HA4199-MV5]
MAGKLKPLGRQVQLRFSRTEQPTAPTFALLSLPRWAMDRQHDRSTGKIAPVD